MRIEWVTPGKGADGRDVDSAEAACTALCDGIRDTYASVDADTLAGLLGPFYALRLPMVTDGRAAVERGDEWSTVVGGILVRLLP